MKLVYRKPFEDFFKEFIETGEGRALIGKMQALEVHNKRLNVNYCMYVFIYS